MDEIEELVKKLESDGCPSCNAKSEMVDDSLVGARHISVEDRFDGPAMIVCLACGNGVRMVGPQRLPHLARPISLRRPEPTSMPAHQPDVPRLGLGHR